MIKLKRAYEPAGGDDGARFLVERLWPRGVRKTRLKLDGWVKDAAPSADLRRWFQPRPKEVAGVSAAVLRRAASASRGLAAAPRCCPARAGHLRLRRARRCAQRRRRTEGVPRSAVMRLWRDACSSKES